MTSSVERREFEFTRSVERSITTLGKLFTPCVCDQAVSFDIFSVKVTAGDRRGGLPSVTLDVKFTAAVRPQDHETEMSAVFAFFFQRAVERTVLQGLAL